jgi:predicted outer membrane repeat protein
LVSFLINLQEKNMTRSLYKPLFNLFALLTFLTSLIGSAVAVTPAYAAGMVVSSNADDTLVNLDANSTCDLREALTNANDDAQTYIDCAAGSGVDVITFANSLGAATITLAADLPLITDSDQLTIDGGADITLDGNSAFHPFQVQAAARLVLESLTVMNGFGGSASGNYGGAIEINSGNVTINNSTFFNNSAWASGAIDNDGGGVLVITNSTFVENMASGNNAGAIWNYHGTLTIRNSTFSGNNAALLGGAIYAESGTINIYNTIMANSVNPSDCYKTTATTITGSNNLIEADGPGAFACGTTAPINSDPDLLPLAGSPAYYPLNVTSPAIDGGDDAVCAAAPVNNTSQNGANRTQGQHCDIGSFEVDSAPIVLSVNRAAANPTAAASVNFTVTFSEPVSGVNTGSPFADFSLITSGVSGAAISSVSGSGRVYTAAVNTGSGNGTIRLDVNDDDSIQDATSKPLGGAGSGNGSFTSGQVYKVMKTGTFADVPTSHQYWTDIEILYANGLTAGCSVTPLDFCPDQIMDRAQSAVFNLRGNFGNSYTPPPPPWDRFADDWSSGAWAERWAEGMYNAGLTAGCATNPLRYCPWDQTPKVQAAVFGVRLKYGNSYVPPAATGTVFFDMTDTAYFGTKWAERAYADGLLPNCGIDVGSGKPLFCPNDFVSRGLGAYMVVRAKNLSMP